MGTAEKPVGLHPVVVTPDVVARYVEAVNAEDWRTVASCYAADAELISVGSLVARGNQAIAHHMQEAMGSLPAHHDQPTRVVDSGAVTILWMTVHGRTTDGRTLTFDAVDVLELSEDRSVIIRNETWWNTAALEALLAGAEPS